MKLYYLLNKRKIVIISPLKNPESAPKGKSTFGLCSISEVMNRDCSTVITRTVSHVLILLYSYVYNTKIFNCPKCCVSLDGQFNTNILNRVT